MFHSSSFTCLHVPRRISGDAAAVNSLAAHNFLISTLPNNLSLYHSMPVSDHNSDTTDKSSLLKHDHGLLCVH
jgi:hypothetical protein